MGGPALAQDIRTDLREIMLLHASFVDCCSLPFPAAGGIAAGRATILGGSYASWPILAAGGEARRGEGRGGEGRDCSKEGENAVQEERRRRAKQLLGERHTAAAAMILEDAQSQDIWRTP